MREQYVKPEAVEISFAMADAIATEGSWGNESGVFDPLNNTDSVF